VNHGRIGHHDDEAERQIKYLVNHICSLSGGLDARRSFIARVALSKGITFGRKLRDAVQEEMDRRLS